MRLWKAFGAATPALIAGPAAEWIGLFKGTYLTNPDWEQQALHTALALSVPSVAAVSLWTEGWSKPWLKRTTGVLVSCTATLCAGIFAVVSFKLGPPSLPELEVVWWQAIWRYLFIAAMVFMELAIAVGILSLPESPNPRRWPWILLGSVCTAALLVVGYYIVRR